MILIGSITCRYTLVEGEKRKYKKKVYYYDLYDYT